MSPGWSEGSGRGTVSSEPTKQMAPEQESGAEDGPADQGLTAGAVLDHGRYRLLDHVGSDARCEAQLWRAKDGVLGRDVALTILVGDRSDSKAAARARRTLERAMHASTFNHVGVARVLDVVTQSPGDPACVLGIVIAEWTHGTDLVDLITEGPLPPGTAARLLQPLAAAVEAAHHAGLVLGADHPQRIRVTPDGDIRMAFPGPMAQATSSDDVRGLGAALYLLLTGRWALPDGPENIPTAPRGSDGDVVPPRTLRPTVPLELSTVALRALGSPDSINNTGGVRTGAAVLRVLEQYAGYDSASTAVQPAADSVDNEVWSTEDPKPDQEVRRKLRISVGVLSVATLLVLGWIISGVIGIFDNSADNDNGGLTVDNEGKPTDQSSAQQKPPEPVAITGGTPYNKRGTPDSPSSIPYLFDNDPATDWSAEQYKQQLGDSNGSISDGSGAVLTLERPVSVREVTINSPSAGSHVEIHRIDGQPDITPNTLIGEKDLNAGETSIPVRMDGQAQQILVVITKLAPEGGVFSTHLNEIKIAA